MDEQNKSPERDVTGDRDAELEERDAELEGLFREGWEGRMQEVATALREQEAERLKAVVAGLVRTGSGHPQVEALARTFHEIYERLAPGFECETREASAKPWGEVPEKNRNLMIATCTELLARGVVVWNGGVVGTRKAKDLPIGSVVADGETSWIKRHPNHWDGTWVWDELDDREIDRELARVAKVLRMGDGK